MVRDFDSTPPPPINGDVLQLLEQKKEEINLLAEQLKGKEEIMLQNEVKIQEQRRQMLSQEQQQQQLVQELKNAHEQLQLEKTKQQETTSKIEQQEQTQTQEHVTAVETAADDARIRVLFGIFTYDDNTQTIFRSRFRTLFDLFVKDNDYRVCSLGNYETAVHKFRNGELNQIESNSTAKSPTSQNREHHDDDFYKKTYENCQYIYTFVIGANRSNDAPTLIAAPVDNTDDLLYPRSPEALQNHILQNEFQDSAWTDLTLLNIQENMNDGKSQTWFHYAALVAKELDIEYVGKWDTDSIPYLDRFFEWLNEQKRLPPSPYNNNIIVGKPVNKDWWWQFGDYKLTAEQEHKEQFFKHNFENHFHIYAQGQCYLMSLDLAYFVAEESQRVLEEGQFDELRKRMEQGEKKQVDKTAWDNTESGSDSSTQRRRLRKQQQKQFDDYIEGHEDHDVASMAFHSPYPIQFQFLSRYQLFWRHGIKNKRGGNAAGIWRDETERLRKWVPLHTNRASLELPFGNPNIKKNSGIS